MKKSYSFFPLDFPEYPGLKWDTPLALSREERQRAGLRLSRDLGYKVIIENDQIRLAYPRRTIGNLIVRNNQVWARINSLAVSGMGELTELTNGAKPAGLRKASGITWTSETLGSHNNVQYIIESVADGQRNNKRTFTVMVKEEKQIGIVENSPPQSSLIAAMEWAEQWDANNVFVQSTGEFALVGKLKYRMDEQWQRTGVGIVTAKEFMPVTGLIPNIIYVARDYYVRRKIVDQLDQATFSARAGKASRSVLTKNAVRPYLLARSTSGNGDELWVLADGEVYRVPKSNARDKNGIPEGGRWEASLPQINRFWDAVFSDGWSRVNKSTRPMLTKRKYLVTEPVRGKAPANESVLDEFDSFADAQRFLVAHPGNSIVAVERGLRQMVDGGGVPLDAAAYEHELNANEIAARRDARAIAAENKRYRREREDLENAKADFPSLRKTERQTVLICFELGNAESAQLLAAVPDLPDIKKESPPLHLTLAIVGDAQMLAPKMTNVRQALAAVAEQFGPMVGKVSGHGRFKNEEDDCIYASFDCPDFPRFRQALVDAFKAVGLRVDMTHGFTPHITLAYLPRATGTPDLDVPMLTIALTAFSVWENGNKTAYPFTGTTNTLELSQRVVDLRKDGKAVWVRPDGALEVADAEGVTLI